MKTNWDNQLIAEFQKLRDDVNRLRDELYSRHPGCACDERGLCAHHAQVFQRLTIISVELMRAIGDAGREG